MLFDSIKYIYCQSAEEEEWVRKGAPKVGVEFGSICMPTGQAPGPAFAQYFKTSGCVIFSP